MFERFFIVGAQRCGTTYLHSALGAHPEVEMAEPAWPEPKFFISPSFAELGVSYYEDHFFDARSAARLKGEKSTSYIEYELAAKRIAEAYPRAAVVMIFRDPVERAISNYWFSVRNGIEKLDIDQALMSADGRVDEYDRSRFSTSPFAYLRRGRYIEYLRLWMRYFAEDRIKVLVFERLVSDKEYLKSVYRFLGVDPSFEPEDTALRVNGADRGDSRVSPKLKQFLADHFRDSIAALAEEIHDPLEEWNAEKR